MKRRLTLNNIIFYILASFLTLFIVMEIFFPDQAIDIIGFRNYAVVSDSMEPEININDVVVVRKIDLDKLQPGDKITFYTYLPTIYDDEEGNTIYQRSVVTHYLGEITSDAEGNIYKTYGIKNNPEFDFDNWKDQEGQPSEIRDEDIIGIVMFKIPWIGTISMFFRAIFTSPIMLLLIALNITIIVVLIKVLKKKPQGN
jgi:signal peptidase I